MPTPPWADDLRLEFLRENLSAYENAQEHNRTSIFLGDMHQRYFAKFPEPDEDLMAKEKKRVSSFMNNHTGSRGHKLDGATSKATRTTMHGLLRGTSGQKKRQKLQPVQAYSALYYKTKWKAVIRDEWDAKLKIEPYLTKANALVYRNSRMKDIYDNESDGVKAEVEHYRNAEPAVETSYLLAGEDALDEKEQSRLIAARERQSAIDRVEAVMSEVLHEIEIITGLKSQLLLSGPEPRRGGKMVMFSIANGKTIVGHRSFKEHHATFKADVNDKFVAFAKACYTREDREKNANVPFLDSPSSISSYNPPPSPVAPDVTKTTISPSVTKKPVAPSAKKKSKARRAGKHVSAASESLPSSNSDGGGEREGVSSTNSILDAAESIVGDEEDESDMDIFSPTLPPDRLIVDSKVTSDGLTLYKTADSKWLSEIELHRLANMARNARLLKELGLDGANRVLRPQGRVGDEEKELEADDDCEFSVARAETSLPPRESYPRLSKQDITYVEKGIDDVLDSISVSASPVPGAGTVATVTCDVTAGATVTDLGSGNQHQPVSGNSISVPDDLPESTAVEPTVPSTFPTSSPLLSNVLPVDAEGHAIQPTPVEVNNHAGLGHDASELNASLEDASLATTITRPTDLDSVDLSKIPSWMCLYLKHFQKHFRGELEDKILGAFVALEMAWQPYNKRISTSGRPTAVTWWIKNARPIDTVPPSAGLKSFPSQVRRWWKTLQPQWRIPVVDDWPLPRAIPNGERWQEARLGGDNGLLLFVLCLYWWRRSAEDGGDSESLSEYHSVAEDVHFVFDAILQSGVSRDTPLPLIGSARANSRTSSKRKATTDIAEETAVKTRKLRSSSVKENVRPSRARRSRT